MKTTTIKQKYLFNSEARFDTSADSTILNLTEESVGNYCSFGATTATTGDVKLDQSYLDDDGNETAWLSPLSVGRRSSTGSDGSPDGFRSTVSNGSIDGFRSVPSYDSGPGYGAATNRRGSGSSYGSGSGSIKSESKAGYGSVRAGSGSRSTGAQSGPNRVRHKAGHTSYADLITRAILSEPEMRMTLAQIYDWMADHVAGLHGLRSLHSSKGWKNAVRHTLSINPRFKRKERNGRPGLWMVESLNLSNRYHTISHGGSGGGSRGGSPATPLTVDAPFLVQSSAQCLESDHFRLTFGAGSADLPVSPDSMDCKPGRRSGLQGVRGTHQNCGCPVFDFNSSRQTIAVIHEDGTKGYLTLPNPVHLAPRIRQEDYTQTDAEVQGVREQKDSFGRIINAKPVVSQPIMPVTDQSWISNSKPKNQFMSLPDDLQDISIDTTLDYGNIWRDEYWF